MKTNNTYHGPENGADIACYRFLQTDSITHSHRHDSFLLLLFEQGEGINSIDFSDHPIAAHQCHLLFPDQVYQWHLKSPAKGYQLIIRKKIFESLLIQSQFSFARFREHPVLNLSKDSFQNLLSEFQCIERELNNEIVFQELIHLRCKLIGLHITSELELNLKNGATNRTKEVIIKFEDLVDQHFREEKAVSFYAAALNISANYLSILCQRESGMPARDIIQGRVLLEAKRLLSNTGSQIKDVADNLGFKDQAHFSNFFKQHTGMSPRQFSKR